MTAQLKPATGVLLVEACSRPSAADNGKLYLTVGTAEATAYGILLDASVDTTTAYGNGTVTASVARAGSFRGAALIVGAGTDEARSPSNCGSSASSWKAQLPRWPWWPEEAEEEAVQRE